jgi:glycosyltransferase involved in cell wall biosynthesis
VPSQEPLVSIIIPTYNRAHLIGETLDSVLAQTYTKWECIIVNDGSTDTTNSVVGSYLAKDPRFKYYHRPSDRPKGANACRNYGFEKSAGAFILFLDSDDLLAKTCVENRMILFVNDQNLDFVISNTGHYEDGCFSNQSLNKDPFSKTSYEYVLLFFSYKLPWTIMSVLWKKNILTDFRYDERLIRFQDVDFHIQVLYRNEFKFMRLYEIDNYYRISAAEKKQDVLFELKLVNSFLLIIDKISELTVKDIKARIVFKRFLYVISRDFIFFNNNTDNQLISLFFQNLKQYKLLDFRDFILFRIMFFYKITKLYNKKGFGVFKFRKFTNHYYNNLSR